MVSPEEVLSFWLDEVGEKGWYSSSKELDDTIRDRFYDTWKGGQQGKLGLWMTYPTGTLAYVILMDQFPRNMFRGDGRSFLTDRRGLAAAKSAIQRQWDMRIDEPARQFFYLPLMHSENLCDQERCIRMICERMPEGRDGQMLHARAHREVIRQFGRFPYRNAALGRPSTAAETAYLAAGGYAETLRGLQQSAAA